MRNSNQHPNLHAMGWKVHQQPAFFGTKTDGFLVTYVAPVDQQRMTFFCGLRFSDGHDLKNGHITKIFHVQQVFSEFLWPQDALGDGKSSQVGPQGDVIIGHTP
jgi:hypothetical protein